MIVKLISKIKKSEDLQELTVNSFWSLLGAFISKGLFFLAWILVARILGKEANGQVGMIRSTINLFLIFVGSGLSLTTTKYIPQFLGINDIKTSRIISLTYALSFTFGLILSIILFTLSQWISSSILNDPNLSTTLKIGAILLFVNSLNSVSLGCLQGLKKFKVITLLTSINGAVVLFFVYFGSLYYSIDGAFIGLTISAITLLICYFLKLKKTFKDLRIDFRWDFLKEIDTLKKFTAPAILAGVMVVPFKWSTDAIMVNNSEGYQELGLFTAIILFQTFLIMATEVVNAPMITLMSKKEVNKEISKINMIVPWFIGIVAVLPIMFFPNFFGQIFGDEYFMDNNYIPTLMLILITTVIMLFKQGIARIMVVNNLMWFSFFSNLIWGLTLIGVLYFSTLKTSVTLALSFLVAYIVNILIIIPVYLIKNIIPKNIILSKVSILIWVLFGIVCFVSFYFTFDIIERSMIFLISIILFIILFFKLIKI